MYENYPVVGQGLKKLFFAEILSVVASLLSSSGLLSMVAGLAGLTLSLLALNTLAPLHPNYKNALGYTIATIIIRVLDAFLSKYDYIRGILSVVSAVLSLLIVYAICTATAYFLAEKGETALASKADVWKLYAVLSVIFVVCILFLFIPILNVLAIISVVLAAVVMIVAGILYMVFLYQASVAFLN